MATDNVVRFIPASQRNIARTYADAVRDQVEPWGAIKDYHERARFVRPVAPVELARATRDDNLDLYQSRAEQERLDRIIEDIRHDDRVIFWQRLIKWGAILLVYAVIAYFAFQIGRGL